MPYLPTQLIKEFFDSITPPPISVIADADGNWLASFNPGEIVVSGQPITHRPCPPLRILPEKYLSSTTYWPADNPQIISIAKSQNSKKIYDYVVTNVEYDYGSAASSTAVRQRFSRSFFKGVCTEFTDLFIALSELPASLPAK